MLKISATERSRRESCSIAFSTRSSNTLSPKVSDSLLLRPCVLAFLPLIRLKHLIVFLKKLMSLLTLLSSLTKITDDTTADGTHDILPYKDE
jgi:hypothetical protein